MQPIGLNLIFTLYSHTYTKRLDKFLIFRTIKKCMLSANLRVYFDSMYEAKKSYFDVIASYQAGNAY